MTDYSKYNDGQLIFLLSLDDKEKDSAFREILKRYGWRVFAYCKQKTQTKDDAKDLNQEIWLAFYNAVKNNKIDIDLPQYLFGIGNKIFAEKCSSNETIKLNEDQFDLNNIIDSSSLNEIIEKNDLINILKLSTNYLNEEQKETFILKYFSGLSIHEIAETTGETDDCIKQRSHRAMWKIINIIKPIIEEFKK